MKDINKSTFIPHNSVRRHIFSGIGSVVLGSIFQSFPGSGFAQTAYPNKNVRILIGYPPGGTADVMARMIAEHLRQSFGQNVIVENRPGASGNIAVQEVVRSQADGHTLLFGNTGEIASNKFLMKDIGFDPDTDLTPIALIYNITHVIAISPKSRYKKLEDLIEDARRRPGKVTYASVGLGSPGHLAGEMLALKTKVEMVHVPYKGTSQALPDLIGGHVDCFITGLIIAGPQLKAGAIRILAVTGPKRSSAAPDIPTVAEVAVPGFDFPLWGGLFAPSKTSKEVINSLNKEVNRVLDLPDVQSRAATLYSEIIHSTPEQFSAFIKTESDKYREIIKILPP